MKEWNVPMLDLNNDNTTLISLNNMTWLQGPFLPVSADKQYGYEIFARLVLGEEEHQMVWEEARAHVSSGKIWQANQSCALTTRRGVCMSCSALGKLIGKQLSGNASSCSKPLSVLQVKGENNKASKPTLAAALFCPDHLEAGGSYQRCIRIFGYMYYLCHGIICNTGGDHILSQLSTWRHRLAGRRELFLAMAVSTMCVRNWTAFKNGKVKPYSKILNSAKKSKPGRQLTMDEALSGNAPTPAKSKGKMPAPSPASTRNQVYDRAAIPPAKKQRKGNDSQASGLIVEDFLKGSGLSREDILEHLRQ